MEEGGGKRKDVADNSNIAVARPRKIPKWALEFMVGAELSDIGAGADTGAGADMYEDASGQESGGSDKESDDEDDKSGKDDTSEGGREDDKSGEAIAKFSPLKKRRSLGVKISPLSHMEIVNGWKLGYDELMQDRRDQEEQERYQGSEV